MPFGKNYLYIPHGPEMDFNAMAGGFKNPIQKFDVFLRELGRQNKSVFIKAEPISGNIAQILVGSGFKKSKKEIQPSKTVVVNLEKDDLDLLGAMHNKTRYNIKVAENHKVAVREVSDIGTFWRLLQKTTERDKFHSHSEGYYKKLFEFGSDGDSEWEIRLFVAEYKKKPVAAAMILVHGETGYYLHGASDYEYRQAMAPFMLHWQIMKLLKNSGVRNYDFWGIDSKKWPGVTRFKLNWGGRLVDHPGSFDLPISKFWYYLYRLSRSFK